MALGGPRGPRRAPDCVAFRDRCDLFDAPAVVSVGAIFAHTVCRALEARAVTLAVFLLTLGALAAAPADHFCRATRREHRLVLDLEGGALEGAGIVHANASDGLDALFLVPPVIVAVVAHAIRRAAHVVAEALAVLLQALGAATPTPAFLAPLAINLLARLCLLVRLWRRVEPAGLVYDAPLRSSIPGSEAGGGSAGGRGTSAQGYVQDAAHAQGARTRTRVLRETQRAHAHPPAPAAFRALRPSRRPLRLPCRASGRLPLRPWRSAGSCSTTWFPLERTTF
jgi:hypothetical protein